MVEGLGTHIKVQRENRIATIHLNRPERLNAITDEMLVGLRDALGELIADPQIGVVVLTGAGKAFCAGQDLQFRDPRTVSYPLDLETIQREMYHPIVQLLSNSNKVTITALNGIAAGAGVGFALAADIVLASRSAKLALSFVRVGLSVDAGIGWQLVRAVGPAKARAMLMSGATIAAEEAERLGLIHKCVDSDELDYEVQTLAQSLLEGPKTAINAIKQAVCAAESTSTLGAYLAEEARLQGTVGATPDYAEGVLAFLEKRTPEFN